MAKRRDLSFGRRQVRGSEHQTRYRPGWYECNGKKVSAPYSRKNPARVGWD